MAKCMLLYIMPTAIMLELRAARAIVQKLIARGRAHVATPLVTGSIVTQLSVKFCTHAQSTSLKLSKWGGTVAQIHILNFESISLQKERQLVSSNYMMAKPIPLVKRKL